MSLWCDHQYPTGHMPQTTQGRFFFMTTATPTVTVRSPYDGTIIGEVPAGTAADVDRAVTAGAAVRADPARALPAWRRAEILDTAARLLAGRVEGMARTIAQEAAKPLKTARVEAQRAADTFTFAAGEARQLAGEVVPMDASVAGVGKLAFTVRHPVGVVGAITPFNFPLNLVAHKVAPAIAAGCPLVLKPASQTPFSARALHALLVDECGLPGDWLHVITGSADEVGNAIVDHDAIAMITFTGSPQVGWSIRERAPRKKVSLELGNNSPVIIEADGDWEGAAAKIAIGGYSHAGQSCISTQRVFVHADIASDFVATLARGVEALVVGDPLDEATDVSSLISEGDRDRVSSWIAEAVQAGAEVAAGGQVEGALLRPTLLTGATPDMKVCREEVFGPVVAVQTYTRFDDALALANDTRYGLQAAVYTTDLGKALRAAGTLDFGAVLVNEVPTWRADQMPYGGVRDSGNTREGPAYAVQEMTESRLVVIQP
jgi:acyl-CoA reductase-like NAD-dependent aldehyde dehydrogenase